MNEKRFDDIVKGKLNDLTPKGDQDVWTFFEAKLDKVDNLNDESNQIFDTIVKEQLLTNHPTYKSEHWRQLKSELKTIEERKNTVFVSKILELAAIFLIFFTFIQWSDGFLEESLLPINSPDLYTTSILPPIESNIGSNGIKSIKSKETLRKSFKQTPSGSKDLLSSNIINLASFNMVALVAEETPKGNLILMSDKKNVIELGNTIDITEKAKILNVNNADGDQVDSKTLIEPYRSASVFTISLETRQLKTLESEFALSFPLINPKVQRNAIFSISVWATTDVNLINTPFDKFYSLASYKKEALNNSFGLNFSTKKSNLELESGIGYSKRVYQPVKITEAYGVFGENYFEKSLNKISYDVVSVPFNFKYHTIHNTGWSAYIMGGAALNLVLNAEYDISETLVRGRPPVGRYVPDMARLDRKPFIQGVLKGDSFRDNYFATVGFGFGIEKVFFRNTSFYIQPSYFRQILSADIGIGPNKDKIHTSSLQVGFKTAIN